VGVDFLIFFSYIIKTINNLKKSVMKNWKELVKEVTLTDLFIITVVVGYVLFITHSMVSAFTE